jgi:hypothetical protein
MYLLRNPLQRYVDRITETETPFGRFKTPVQSQEDVKEPDVSKPPTLTAGAEPELKHDEVSAAAATPDGARSGDDQAASLHEQLDECRGALHTAQDELQRWAFAWELERIYNNIYGSQLRLLVALEAGPIPFNDVVNAMRAAEEIAKSPIPTFLSFLNNAILVQTRFDIAMGAVYELTTKGRDFLAYCRAQGLLLNKPGW